GPSVSSRKLDGGNQIRSCRNFWLGQATVTMFISAPRSAMTQRISPHLCLNDNVHHQVFCPRHASFKFTKAVWKLDRSRLTGISQPLSLSPGGKESHQLLEFVRMRVANKQDSKTITVMKLEMTILGLKLRP